VVGIVGIETGRKGCTANGGKGKSGNQKGSGAKHGNRRTTVFEKAERSVAARFNYVETQGKR